MLKDSGLSSPLHLRSVTYDTTTNTTSSEPYHPIAPRSAFALSIILIIALYLLVFGSSHTGATVAIVTFVPVYFFVFTSAYTLVGCGGAAYDSQTEEGTADCAIDRDWGTCNGTVLFAMLSALTAGALAWYFTQGRGWLTRIILALFGTLSVSMDARSFFEWLIPAMDAIFDWYYTISFVIATIVAIFTLHCIKTDHAISLLLIFGTATVGSTLFAVSFGSLVDLYLDDFLPEWFTSFNITIVTASSFLIQAFITGKNAHQNWVFLSCGCFGHLYDTHSTEKRKWYPFQDDDVRFKNYMDKKIPQANGETLTHHYSRHYEEKDGKVVEILTVESILTDVHGKELSRDKIDDPTQAEQMYHDDGLQSFEESLDLVEDRAAKAASDLRAGTLESISTTTTMQDGVRVSRKFITRRGANGKKRLTIEETREGETKTLQYEGDAAIEAIAEKLGSARSLSST
jgi:hypothetical protein